ALGHHHADIPSERGTKDDIDQVDTPVELHAFLVKLKLHHHFSGRWVKPARSSIARPALSTISSSSSLPMRWSPSGRPCSSRPPGTDIAGKPAGLAGTANTSLRYIASGSVVSPIPNAAEGAVGVRITSHCSNALRKSCLIRVRTFGALLK